MKNTFSIRHYAMGFSIAICLLFFSFGVLTYQEVSSLQKDLKSSNYKIAEQELIAAIVSVELGMHERIKGFANWEEVSQQIRNPLYYAYWHNHRALQTGLLPRDILDVALYNKAGQVLSKLDTTTMPMQINEGKVSSYVDIVGGKPQLVIFSEVLDEGNNDSVIGYAGSRINMMPELSSAKQFNYLDQNTLQVMVAEKSNIPVADLLDFISFSLKPNPVMDEIMNVVVDMLARMALIIGVPTLLLYPMVTYLIARPLHKISNHIDELKNNTASEDLPDLGRMLAVTELEKVRSSLNEYHIKLFKVHSSLDDKNKELWTLAHHDSLTGALNRRAFDEHWRNLNDIFSDGRIEICLAVFDVNSFKAFNDSYGHHIGDEVLKGISESIMKVLRKNEKLYRLGGDEFACVFVDSTKEEALHVAERCEKEIAAYPFSEHGIKEPVRVSIGLSHASKMSQNELSALQWQADFAMYSAKKPGKSHLAFYTEDMRTSDKGVFSSWINNVVYEAITDGTGISMHYQPIVTLDDQRPDYYEALIRIKHEDKTVMPLDIFQLVEARRLEKDMDMIILEKIYTDLKNDVLPVGTGVSMNISGPSIVDKEIVAQLERFSQFVSDYKIVLEITETALITQIDDAVDNLIYLRKLGFLVALDDFGSGYSSIRYLATMPVDIVKFDITLIRSLGNENQKTIVKHLANMISETGHKLVAEGIETQELLAQVNELDFVYGQGYLFGKPVARPKIGF